ncbi:MAG: hypothetical protein IIA65_08305, partial [Planctomycetes bacterium]|nr:hypothetical protein [Planctomycetota bacterium]
MKTEQICPHSVKVLEFDLILDTLASFASSDLGKKAAKRITPSTQRPWIEKRLGETSQLKALLDQGVRLPLSGLRDIGPRIRDLGLKQTLFEPEDLIEISDTLSVSGQMKRFLGRLSVADSPLLRAMGDKLHSFEDLTRRINHCIDGSEGVLDRATEPLQSIRRQLRVLEGEIRRQFSRIVSDPQMRSALENDNFMLRHGRPVVAVKSHYRTRLRGTVLDRSHSGATLYIQPDGLVELSNQLEETRFAEKKEIDNILWDLTHRVLARRDDIFDTLRNLAFVDLTYAKARFSTDYEMSAPHLGDSLRLNSARHPLLLQWASAEYDRPVRELDQHVIPISPRLGDDF